MVVDETQAVEALLSELGLSVWNLHHLLFLIRTESEMNYFMTHYWRDRNYQLFAIAEYHKERIEKRNLQFEEFSTLYIEGASKGKLNNHYIEQLFLRPIDMEMTGVINTEVERDVGYLRRLYDHSMANVCVNASRVIRQL